MEDGDIQIRDLWGPISRPRLRGDKELQPRCYHTGRRAQRRRFEGLASRGDRSRVAGREAGRARRARAEGEVSDGVAAMSFVVQLRVCDANLKAYTAVRNAAWFQRRRITRRYIDFHRTSLRRRCGNANSKVNFILLYSNLLHLSRVPVSSGTRRGTSPESEDFPFLSEIARRSFCSASGRQAFRFHAF